MDINIFTAAMRKEFLSSMQAAARPARVDTFTTIVPSTARIENYAWMTPAPGISRYKGYRRLARMGQVKYSIENYEYDGSFSVDLRDVEDDQVGGYKLRMQDLVKKSGSPFRNRLVLQFAAAGQTNTCFDGSPFFNTGATAHNLGGFPTTSPFSKVTFTGGNTFTYAPTAADTSNKHAFAIFLNNPDSPLRPLLFQNRKPPKMGTDAGTQASEKAKRADYWLDLEAAVGHGYWWDAVLCKFNGTPTVLEAIEALDAARQIFRQFSLPVSLPTDPIEYPHEQLEMTPETVNIVCSVGIETTMDRVLNESYYGISQAGSSSGVTPNNLYFKKFTLIPTNTFNSIT